MVKGLKKCPHCGSVEGFYVNAELRKKVSIVFNYRGEEVTRIGRNTHQLKEHITSDKAFCVTCKKQVSKTELETVLDELGRVGCDQLLMEQKKLQVMLESCRSSPEKKKIESKISVLSAMIKAKE